MNTSDFEAAIAERYRVDGEIGRGGMAIVYRAQDLRHDRPVAIKVLRPELAASLGADRFVLETKTAARLQHPNIVALYDSGRAGEFLYYVMPFVEGRSLADRLSEQPQLEIDEAIRIGREVAEALAYAHEHGIVHRDIKPGNILLSSGHALIADFGIAHALSEAGGPKLTESGLVLGTPAYMSPEQASGEASIDGRSDIYALGCVLFEMLAGEPPFSGRTPRATLVRHIAEPTPPISALRPGLPDHVVNAVETALAKAPVDRFSTGSEFSKALVTAEVRSASRRKPLSKWRWAAAATIGAAVFALAAAWLGSGTEAAVLDPNKVVVFPLASHGLSAADSGAGFTAALAVYTALEHTEPLRWVDGRRWLGERDRERPHLLGPDTAQRISRDRRAAYYIDGEISAIGDSATVVLRLNDVAGDSLVARQSAIGLADIGGLAGTTIEAVTRLLPHLVDPGRAIDLSAISDRSLSSIALFLQGERAYRRSNFSAALALYDRALQADSTFAFAAVKGAQAAGWEHRDSQADALIAASLRHQSLLPGKHADFARGVGAYIEGNADSAVSYLNRARMADPEWAEASAMLGETYYHLMPTGGSLGALAEKAFEAATEADSGFAPPLLHLIEISVRNGDLERAERLFDAYSAAEPPPQDVKQITLMLSCASGESIDWDSAVTSDPLAVFAAARQLSIGAAYSECAKRAFEAILASDDTDAETLGWGSFLAYQGLLVAEGQSDSVVAMLESASPSSPAGRGKYFLYIIDALAGGEMAEQAADADEFVRDLFGQNYETLKGPLTLWLVGVWNAHRRDAYRVRLVAAALQQVADSSSGERHRSASLCAAAMLAHLELADGDTTKAIDSFRRLTPSHPLTGFTWQLAEPLAVERITLARVLFARGEYAETIEVASAFDHPNAAVFLPFIPESLALRLRSAKRLGDSEMADSFEHRLADLGRLDLVRGASVGTSQQ